MKSLFRVASVLIAVALAISAVGSASASDSALELVGPINEASNVGAGQPTNYVFRDITKTFNYSGGPVCLSSRGDQCSPPAIDDAVRIYVDGTEVFYQESYTHDFGPVDFSGKLHVGSNQVRVQLIDLMGPSRGGSALYLVPTSGGGGGGGGGGFICPEWIAPEIPFFEMSASIVNLEVANYIHEWTADLAVQYCASQVTLNIDPTDDVFELEGPTGSISFDSELNLTGVEYQINKTNPQFIYGFLGANSAYPGDPYFGYRQEQSTNLTEIFSLTSEHEIRNIFKFKPIDYNYNPAQLRIVATMFMLVVLAAAAAIVGTASAPYVAITSMMILWFTQVTGVAPNTPLNPTVLSPSLMTTRLQVGAASPVILPSPDALGLFNEQYGDMAQWADVYGLSSERAVVSAYTEFDIAGSGFSPNGEIYYEFGLPGQPALLKNFATANGNGDILIHVVMPPPNQTPLGNYLLVAFDYTSMNQTMLEALSANPVPTHFVAAVTTVEVVEDVTPPTITILSPLATNYTRSDHPYISFNVTDDLSGVGVVNAWLDGIVVNNGLQLDMLFWSLGEHTLKVQAFDKVGWEQNQSVTFRLIATIPSLQQTVNRLCAENYITKQGICTSLSQKLKSALSAQQRGQNKTAVNVLLAFQNELKAQKGKAVTVQAYDLLMMDSNYVIQALGGK